MKVFKFFYSQSKFHKAYRKQRISLLIICLFINQLAIASLHKNLWPKWEVHNPLSREVISHQEWQAFLSRCVTTNEEGINLIDYSRLSQADRQQLQRYIRQMSSIDISQYSRKEQLAFWLNLYNALTIELISRYYPIPSIQEINTSPGLFSIGPWEATIVTINQVPLTLDDIYHRIIRPVWNDPRTHYALSNSSMGGPNLPTKAFEGNSLDSQLNEAAANYINSLRGVQMIDGQLVVSKLYQWFLEDFGENEKDLIWHLSQYAREPLRKQLRETHSVNTYVYNWHLNDTLARE